MRRKLLYIIFFAIFHIGAYGAEVQDPPEPTTKSHENGANGPCGQPDQGRGVPPPVGLCLPINDYLLPLLISGILLGAYKVRKSSRV